MPLEETGETRVRTDCLNFRFSLCIQIKNKFQLEEEGTGIILCGILDQDCTKFPITNVLLRLVRDISTKYVTIPAL